MIQIKVVTYKVVKAEWHVGRMGKDQIFMELTEEQVRFLWSSISCDDFDTRFRVQGIMWADIYKDRDSHHHDLYEAIMSL